MRYPSSQQNTIGLLKVGHFDMNLNIMTDGEEKVNASEQSLFEMLSRVAEMYYGMKVEILSPIRSKDVTSRFNENCGVKQPKQHEMHYLLVDIRMHSDSNCVCI